VIATTIPVNTGNAWATNDQGLPYFYFQKLGGGARHGAEGGIPVPECKAGTFEGAIAWCSSVLVLIYQSSNVHTSHVSSLRMLISLSQSQGAAPCSASFPAGSMKCPAHKAPAPTQLHQRCSAEQHPAQKRTARRKAAPCPGGPMMPLT
jgi:hypothetical protein